MTFIVGIIILFSEDSVKFRGTLNSAYVHVSHELGKVSAKTLRWQSADGGRWLPSDPQKRVAVEGQHSQWATAGVVINKFLNVAAAADFLRLKCHSASYTYSIGNGYCSESFIIIFIIIIKYNSWLSFFYYYIYLLSRWCLRTRRIVACRPTVPTAILSSSAPK